MKKVIFIWSVGWSGSTLLDCMIGSGPDCFACGEVYVVYRKYPTAKLAPIWVKAKKLGESKLYDYIFSIPRFKNVNTISDSSKDTRYFLRQMKNNAKKHNIRHILIYKHPLNYLYSGYKRWNRPPYRVKHAANKLFFQYQKYHGTFFSLKLKNPIFVSCERLTQNPSDMLKKICKKLGVRYFEGKEQFWNFPHYTIGGGILVNLLLSKWGSTRNEYLTRIFLEQKNRSKKFTTKPMIAYDDWKKKLPLSFAKCNSPLCQWHKTKSFELYGRMERQDENIR